MSVDEQARLRLAMLTYWPAAVVPISKLEADLSTWRPRLLLVDTYSITVWVKTIGAVSVALVWGWCEVSLNGACCITQTDASRIETNALLIDEKGIAITAAEKVIRLNAILLGLEWYNKLFDAEFIIRSAKEYLDALQLLS